MSKGTKYKVVKNSEETAEEIEKMRSLLGFSPVRKGYIDCLKCGYAFDSEDVKNQRMCDSCKTNLKNWLKD